MTMTSNIGTKLTMVLIFALCVACTNNVELQEARLHKVLFQNYNPRVRPILEHTRALDVQIVTIYLWRVTDLSEKHQQLSSSIWIDIRWTDELLRWNKSDYDGVSSILADKTKIWTPDLLIQNAKGDNRGLNEIILNDPIVMWDGAVLWWPDMDIITTCDVDATKYPFDSQFCELVITKWYSSDSSVNLIPTLPSFDLSYYENSEKWVVHSGAIQTELHFIANQNFTRFKYGLTLQRRPLHYVLTIIVPFIMLSLLNQLCFLLPIKSGEKVGMCMSIFLTFVVFLTLISDTLPKSSIHISIFEAYLVFQLVVSGSIIGLEVIVLYTYHTHQKQVKDRNTQVYSCGSDDVSPMNSDDVTMNKLMHISTEPRNDLAPAQIPEPNVNRFQKAAKLNRILGCVVLGVNSLTCVGMVVVLQT